jgi:hypothetical protein
MSDVKRVISSASDKAERVFKETLEDLFADVDPLIVGMFRKGNVTADEMMHIESYLDLRYLMVDDPTEDEVHVEYDKYMESLEANRS